MEGEGGRAEREGGPHQPPGGASDGRTTDCGSSSGEVPMTSTGKSSPGGHVMRFEKMEGQATMEGELYELKLAALLFLRMRNHPHILRFQLACNVKGAGAMDDLVARFKTSRASSWRTVFTQLKHKRSTKLTLASLTKSKDFALSKYFESAVKIEKAMTEDGSGGLFDGRYDACEFVLYTTATVHEKLRGRWRDVTGGEVRGLLSTGSAEETVFKVSKAQDMDIFSSISGDDEAVEKFLNSLTVFSGQASEGQLDDMIRRELLLACDMTKSAVELVYPYYRDTFKDWWRDSDEILDEGSDILQRAVNSFQIKNLSREQEKSTCLDLKFQEGFLFELDASENVRVIHIVCDRLLTKVACTKLNQTLQRTEDLYTFLSLDVVLRETSAVVHAWRGGAKHSLVVVSLAAAEHGDLCTELSRHLLDDETKSSVRRIIIVSSEDDQFTLRLKSSFPGQFREIHDSFQLSQLEPEYLAKINRSELLFQEREMTFCSLVNKETSSVPGVLNDTFLENTLSGSRVSLGPRLDDDISYYIPRTLERLDILQESVLQEKNMKDVFVVVDITLQELSMMVQPGTKVAKVRDARSAECRYLVSDCDSEEDINTAFERKENVHVVRMCPDGCLRWTRTKGSVVHISRFIDRGQLTSYNPCSVVDLDCRIVLVEAQPGMGKSTVATHLAQATKLAHPGFWVISIALSKVTGLLDRSSCSDAREFLESAVGIDAMSDTEKALFRYSLEVGGDVVVFLDGYDEISPQYTDKGCALLTSLSRTKARKIVVTTRHSMRAKLEAHLSTVAFTLLQFSEENQREFFLRYWNKDEECALVASDDGKELLNQMLKQITQSMNDKASEFLGIPLHAMMLAEIYEDFFKTPGTEIVPEKLDLLTLFEKVIDKKFQIYLRKKFPDNKNISHEIKELLKPVYKDHMNAALVVLMEATQLLRLNKVKKILEKTKKFSKKIQDSNNKTGIVDRFSDGKPIFLHRTFSEYFAARWFSKNFQENRDFLRDHLFTDEFKVIRSMFDLMLSRKSKVHTAVLYNNVPSLRSLLASDEDVDVNAKDKGGRSVVHLAAALGFDSRIISPITNKMADEHVLRLLLLHGADANVKDEVLEWTGIEYAMVTKSWDALELILEKNPENDCSGLLKVMIEKDGLGVPYNEWRYLDTTLLHQAAAYGQVHIVKMFLSCSLDFLHKGDDNQATALHEACIWNNVSVVRALIDGLGGDADAVRSFVDTRDKHGWSALHYSSLSGASLTDCRKGWISRFRGQFGEGKRKQKKRQSETSEKVTSWPGVIDDIDGPFPFKDDVVEIIKLLVANGGDVIAGDDQAKTTPLHLACVLGEVNVVRALIECVGDDTAHLGLKGPTVNDSQRCNENLEEGSSAVVQYVELKDDEGRCALHYAAEGGSAEVVNLLIDKGGNIWSRDDLKNTPLQYACWFGGTFAVETLIERLAGDKEALGRYVNTPSSVQGWCPLHFAALGGRGEIVRALVNAGADPRSRGFSGVTPLVVAVTEFKLDCVRALVENLGDEREVAAHINTPDPHGRTAVHACANVGDPLGRDVIIMHYLVSKGGNVLLRDAAAATPLHLAAARLDMVQAVVSSLGEDKDAVRRFVNRRDEAGRTVLHHAARDPTSGVLQFLISKGGDIWIRDNEGRSLYSMVTLEDLLYTGAS